MKEMYKSLEIEIIPFDSEDIIRVSGPSGGGGSTAGDGPDMDGDE